MQRWIMLIVVILSVSFVSACDCKKRRQNSITMDSRINKDRDQHVPDCIRVDGKVYCEKASQ